jgi:Autographiviridae endonuclease VII
VARKSKNKRDGNNKINSKRNRTASGRKYRDEQHRQTSLARRRHLEKERYREDSDYRRGRLEYNQEYRAVNKEEINRKRRKRRATDPEYREQDRARSRERYRENHLKTKYGISLADYEAMLRRQGGVCGICKRKPGKRRLCVDHDHKTGQVRGLLCGRCNSGNGFYGDDPRLTRAATAYLEAAHARARRQSASPARRKRKPPARCDRATVARRARRTRAGPARRVRRTVSPFGPRPQSKKGPGRGHHRGRVAAVCEPTGSYSGSRQRA